MKDRISIILITFVILFSQGVMALTSRTIKEVKVICDGRKAACAEYLGKYDVLKGQIYDDDQLKEFFRLKLSELKLKRFFYQTRGSSVYITLSPYQLVQSISLTMDSSFTFDKDSFLSSLPLKKGDIYTTEKIKYLKEELTRILSNSGVLNPKVEVKNKFSQRGASLSINLESKGVVKVSKIKIHCDNLKKCELIQTRFNELINKPWSLPGFKFKTEKVLSDLKADGYYNAQMKVLPHEIIDEGVDLRVNFNIGKRFLFGFRGNKKFTNLELDQHVRDFILKGSSTARLASEKIVKDLVQKYNSIGLYNSVIKSSNMYGKTHLKEEVHTVYINIQEGKKVPLSNVVFIGNRKISKKEMKKIFFSGDSILTSRGFLDEAYLEKFSKALTRNYLSKGFVFADISKPKVTYLKVKQKKKARIEFRIKERQQAIVKEIAIKGVGKELVDDIISKITNKSEEPINIIEIERDVALIARILREKGYFFATIKTKPKNTIIYKANYTEASLVVDVDLGKKAIFESSIISGNNKTRSLVVEREIKLNKGDILTPKKLSNIKRRVNELGLFSSVTVTPHISNKSTKDDHYKINLIFELVEKDFNALELAFGYRTDLGFRGAFNVVNSNRSGRNHTLSFKGEANLRVNSSGFDERRRAEDNRRVEGSFNIGYTYPYVFSEWAFDTSLSAKRKRFIAFDADIASISPRLSRVFEFDDSSLSTSFQFLYEEIRTSDATEEKDRDAFQIGTLSTSILFDKRSSSVAPRSGYSLGLSLEYASPYFRSTDNEDLKVHYYKVISRNKLYVPLADDFVLALSTAVGLEKNLSNEIRVGELDENGEQETNGYIPSLKVFSMDGVDSVRGYKTSEINRLLNGSRISEVVVRDKALFFNLKIEPRYYLSDTIVLGLFFDAGRVYVNTVKPLKLRKSFGGSLKVVTPVGSLDFDYGVKLDRREPNPSQKEAFGRFHVNIGFF